MRRQVLALAGLVLIAACADQPVSGPEEPTPAPLLGVAQQGGPLQDRYIVVFKDNVGDVDAEIERGTRGFGAQVHYRYYSAIKGFAATLPAPALEGLRRNPNVSYIEADGEMSIVATQSPATWGLDRIDQRNLSLNNSYTYNSTGAGVQAYIIDTGILTSHSQFDNVRATSGKDFVDNDNVATDCNGHGTHVAGTVGGKDYGVAKGVSLVAVRVLNCSGSGTTSGVIAGVEWVGINHVKPAVANMSLGGSTSSALDAAVSNAVAAGVTFFVAAGNSNRDACRFSPARVASAITVGATTSTDSRASYSNYGSCLDLFAPGSSITSAWYTSNTATNTISGTSMASPHAAGVAALFLSVPGNGSKTPQQVRDAIVANATSGAVKSPGKGSPNLLLFTNY